MASQLIILNAEYPSGGGVKMPKKNNQPELQEQGSPPIVWGPKSSLHPQYLGIMLDTSTSEWIDKQIEN